VNGKGIATWAMSPVKRLNAITRPASLSNDRSGTQWRASVAEDAVRTVKS
jgi:hypothetical protein